MTDKQRKICEDLDWEVHECGDGTVELEKYSPAGEDYSFCIDCNDVAAKVREHWQNFDPEEHITELIVAKRNGLAGVPDIKTLCHDADAIEEMISELAEALEEAEQEDDGDGA